MKIFTFLRTKPFVVAANPINGKPTKIMFSHPNPSFRKSKTENFFIKVPIYFLLLQCSFSRQIGEDMGFSNSNSTMIGIFSLSRTVENMYKETLAHDDGIAHNCQAVTSMYCKPTNYWDPLTQILHLLLIATNKG